MKLVIGWLSRVKCYDGTFSRWKFSKERPYCCDEFKRIAYFEIDED